MKTKLTYIIIGIILTTNSFGQEKSAINELEYYDSLMSNYKFKDYRFKFTCIKEFYKDSLIWGDLESLPKDIKNNIEIQYKIRESNFGGCYKIVIWNCGLSCQNLAVFNRQSGKCIGTLNASFGFKYQPNRRLIITNPPLDQKLDIENRRTFGEPGFYELVDDKIKLIKE